jgi:hypothetical protein
VTTISFASKTITSGVKGSLINVKPQRYLVWTAGIRSSRRIIDFLPNKKPPELSPRTLNMTTLLDARVSSRAALGNIYTVSNTGVATLLANVGEDAEGLSFAPQAFGGFAKGTLFVASENSGTLRAITAGGAVTGIPGAEMVSFVPLNLGSSGNPVEGFYAANFPNNIIKADASQFTPFMGDAIITSETIATGV